VYVTHNIRRKDLLLLQFHHNLVLLCGKNLVLLCGGQYAVSPLFMSQVFKDIVTCVELVYLFTLECVCMPLGRCTSSRATSGLFEMQSSTESPVLEITLLYNPGSFCRPACLHQCLHFTAQPQMLLWPACYLELACTNYHSPYIWETQLGNTDTDRLIENQTVQ